MQKQVKMALAANRIRVQQYGDAVVGEQTQVVYDEETGIVGQKKTMVAQVPTEGGGTAYIVAEQVEVERVVRSFRYIYHSRPAAKAVL